VVPGILNVELFQFQPFAGRPHASIVNQCGTVKIKKLGLLKTEHFSDFPGRKSNGAVMQKQPLP